MSPIQSNLLSTLFDESLSTYALLDGAGIPKLRLQLAHYRAECVCFFDGETDPQLLDVAPYLVHIKQGMPLTSWILDNGWGRNWGVFVLSAAKIHRVASHLRNFLIMRESGRTSVYFRYYDPRVLRVYLRTCNLQELEMIFDSEERFVMEGESGEGLVFDRYSAVPRVLPTG